jgi:hypothetical protein
MERNVKGTNPLAWCLSPLGIYALNVLSQEFKDECRSRHPTEGFLVVKN